MSAKANFVFAVNSTLRVAWPHPFEDSLSGAQQALALGLGTYHEGKAVFANAVAVCENESAFRSICFANSLTPISASLPTPLLS